MYTFIFTLYIIFHNKYGVVDNNNLLYIYIYILYSKYVAHRMYYMLTY